jgi:hypothetical protein
MCVYIYIHTLHEYVSKFHNLTQQCSVIYFLGTHHALIHTHAHTHTCTQPRTASSYSSVPSYFQSLKSLSTCTEPCTESVLVFKTLSKMILNASFCIHVYVCTPSHMYIYIYIHTHTHANVKIICVYIYMHMSLNMHSENARDARSHVYKYLYCMHMSIHLCMCMCLCMHVYDLLAILGR